MLQGSLENFALDEVLGLLAGTSKTGRLEIAGNRGTGVLSFNTGHLVDATASYTANGTGLEDVMFELLRFSDGTFNFKIGDIPMGESPENVASVLAAAESRLRDWRSIESIVPTLKHQVAPIAELPADEVTISRAEWAALRVIASGCPVSTVCDKLELGEVEGSRHIKDLAQRDLVVINEPIGGYSAPTAPTAEVSNGIAAPAPMPAPAPAPPVEDFSSEMSAIGTVPPAPTAMPETAELGGYDPLGAEGIGAEAVTGDATTPDGMIPDSLNGDANALDASSGLFMDDRPPMPPAPDAQDLLAEAGAADDPPAPPSPAEISSFGEEIEDVSELVQAQDDSKGGGLLARYLKSDD